MMIERFYKFMIKHIWIWKLFPTGIRRWIRDLYYGETQDTFPPLPPLPHIAPEIGPQKVLSINGHGEILVSNNFSDIAPIWRKYRRLGWALRYLGVTKEEYLDSVKHTQTDS